MLYFLIIQIIRTLGCQETFYLYGRHHCRGCGISLCQQHVILYDDVVNETRIYVCEECDIAHKMILQEAYERQRQERLAVKKMESEDSSEDAHVLHLATGTETRNGLSPGN